MLDNFYYINSNGDKIEFGKDGIFANYNDIRDYEWSYQISGKSVFSFSKDLKTKNLPVVFVCDRKKRNEFFRIVEADVKAQKNGRLYINGYYLNCFFIASRNSEYLKYKDFLITNWTILTADPEWHKEISFLFQPQSASDSGIDYPFDYPHDYNVFGSGNTFENPFDFASDFKLTIYGSASDPTVTIGGHIYKLNCDIDAGDRVEVLSTDKTINLVESDGSKVNFFNYREKEVSIFEQIKAGVNQVVWDGSFMFDLTLIDSRSEPVWEEFSDEPIPVPEPDVPVVRDYLLDFDGENILDYWGGRIGA